MTNVVGLCQIPTSSVNIPRHLPMACEFIIKCSILSCFAVTTYDCLRGFVPSARIFFPHELKIWLFFQHETKISNSSSKFTEILLEKCRVRLFILCLFQIYTSIIFSIKSGDRIFFFLWTDTPPSPKVKLAFPYLWSKHVVPRKKHDLDRRH